MVKQSEATLPSLELRHYRGELPPEILQMRRDIYQNEKGYLSAETIQTIDDLNGITLGLYNAETGELMATGQAVPAEHSEFMRYSEVNPKFLEEAVYVTRNMVAPQYRHLGLGKAILYLAMREARLMGRESIVFFGEEGDIAAKRIIQFKENTHIPKRIVRGNGGRLFPMTTYTISTQEGMTRCYYKCSAELQKFLSSFAGDEAKQTVVMRLNAFLQNPYFASVYEHQMTREQYIKSLRNTYQFVRWTTRIIARAVSLSEDKKLRLHFIKHLQEEVDHEVIIEKDLETLGDDVDYVRNLTVPNVYTQQFMVIQESFLAHSHDPILYLSVPFSIEGFTANLPKKFIHDLQTCVRSWGIQHPQKATQFWASHIAYDGGEHGHWAHNIEIAEHCLSDELQLQRFLNGIHLTMDSLEKCYNSFVSAVDFTQVRPNKDFQYSNHADPSYAPLA